MFLGARIDGLLVQHRKTLEGEVIHRETKSIDLGVAERRLLLRWPVIVEHKINEKSPLWKFSREDMLRKDFEILVVLEGKLARI